ncbi:hypothetical protein OsJ_32297 [Oryza sativa Japonica Group]|uniref:Peptidase A1 domain-containing protein n=1 Tax=Oryza sativa subsp. japonica TaxID=39947 RepID=A3C6W2_ORYSJ|nr:hypothetical protein OsJ_32297 [Oryza sativa Japonica Group]
MGRLVTTLLVLCLIYVTTCSLSTRTAAFRAHDLRRGLEQAMRGRLLADATPAGGSAVPIHWSRHLYNVANFTIGTPPQPASAIIDVAGPAPCSFPNASSTFRPEPCGTDACKSIPTSNCSSNMCTYEGTINSKLGGHTLGIVATDTFAIGTATASLGFGCVVASGIDTMGGPSGLIGLGRAPSSLVSQMNITKFSYCLTPHDSGKNSRLLLGSSAKLAGGGNSTTTPFVKTSPGDDMSQYYPIQLDGIKAGDAAIALPPSGNTVLVQTLAPMSFLVDSAYQALKKEVTKAVGAAPTATPLQPFDLCFPKAGLSNASAPDLVFTFQQGAAALTVPPPKYLIDVGEEKGTVCMAILSTSWLNTTALDENLNILGSLQQENTHFLLDLEKKTLSFEPADCAHLSLIDGFLMEAVLALAA